MARTLDQLSRRGALVEVARQLYGRGWMAGTAGNLSARALPGESAPDWDAFWITASGLPKGQLEERDFLLVEVARGEVIHRATGETKPSAETSIHQVLYQLFPHASSCLHGHTVDAALAARDLAADATALPLPPLEMIKGLGIWDETPAASLPVFPNYADVKRIAEEIKDRFSATPPAIPALLIRNHGVTVWGTSIQESFNRLECLEFVLSYMARSA